MGIEYFNQKKDLGKYICDECKRESLAGYAAIELLPGMCRGWLKFQDGRTFCPECLAKRSNMSQAWQFFLRRRCGCRKETGIDDNIFLYRFWQLCAVFPNIQYKYGYETCEHEEGRCVHVCCVPDMSVNDRGCTIYITGNGKIQFSGMVEVG